MEPITPLAFIRFIYICIYFYCVSVLLKPSNGEQVIESLRINVKMQSAKQSFTSWLKKQDIDIEDLPGDSKLNQILKEKAKSEVKQMLETPENIEPDRGNLEDSTIKWRYGKPDYAIANLAYLMGKSQCHAKGSLEILIENAVKTWEMEASHKVDTAQWGTVIQEKYKIQANGGKIFGLEEAVDRGNYNVLMDHVDTNLYDAANQDFETSHHLFRNALQGGFPWEVLQVYSGPPEIVFSWRHWGEFTGYYEGNKGHGELVEMTGFVAVKVTEELKITDLKVFYKPEGFLRDLKGQEVIEKKPKLTSTSSFYSWLDSLQLNDDSSLTEKAEEELRKMSEIRRPDRSRTNESDLSLAFKGPDYSLVDLAYLLGKSCSHKEESVESFVENLVKTCEMEISHKAKSQWKTLSNDSKVYVNGEDISDNLESFIKTSEELFVKAFPWEVTEVFSKAPNFSFTWRHWLEVKETKNGGKITTKEIKGFGLINLNEKEEVKTIKVYYKPDDVPNKDLEGIRKCPFANDSS